MAGKPNNKYSYDEKYKGPYKHKRGGVMISGNLFSGIYFVYDWEFTMHDYWKGFKRNDNFKECFDFAKEFHGSGVPKYFKMKSEEDVKKDKKKKGKMSEEE